MKILLDESRYRARLRRIHNSGKETDYPREYGNELEESTARTIIKRRERPWRKYQRVSVIARATVEFRLYRFRAIILAQSRRRAHPPTGEICPDDRAENIRTLVRRYRAMRNSSKPRLSAAERLYLAELVRLELTSLN